MPEFENLVVSPDSDVSAKSFVVCIWFKLYFSVMWWNWLPRIDINIKLFFINTKLLQHRLRTLSGLLTFVCFCHFQDRRDDSPKHDLPRQLHAAHWWQNHETSYEQTWQSWHRGWGGNLADGIQCILAKIWYHYVLTLDNRMVKWKFYIGHEELYLVL